MNNAPTLADCRALDAQDPLRALRDLFFIPEGTIYLDGNSLGVMPRSAPARVAEVVTQESVSYTHLTLPTICSV